jgi:dihydrofolate synthase/folylpolyglutamate synthase
MTAARESVAAALKRFGQMHSKGIDLSLGRTYRLLAALDNPQDRLPPVVHVAGTNGKGSTVAFCRAIAEASGATVHTYTSPHLVRFNERIRVGGEIVDDERLAEALARTEKANGDHPITFFEITTAAAFLLFAETKADLVVLETGLGGRLDSTNVVAQPAATAITQIAWDHMDYLGDTLEKIAGEKAGIIKSGAPCTLAFSEVQSVADVFRRTAQERRAPLLVENAAWRVTPKADGGFAYADEALALDLPPPGLRSAHQIRNAAQAIATLRQVDALNLTPETIARGVAAVEWPGRMQRLTRGPLLETMPTGGELWLDGGHNPGAAAVLVPELARWNDRPLTVILALKDGKDPRNFLGPLAPHIATLRTVPIPGDVPFADPARLATLGSELGIADCAAAESIAAALAALAPERKGRVLILGSLYLAGWVLAENG